LEELIPLINKTVNAFTQEHLEAEYPIFFDKPKTSNSYVLVQLLLKISEEMYEEFALQYKEQVKGIEKELEKISQYIRILIKTCKQHCKMLPI
jgi:hypothetical protein